MHAARWCVNVATSARCIHQITSICALQSKGYNRAPIRSRAGEARQGNARHLQYASVSVWRSLPHEDLQQADPEEARCPDASHLQQPLSISLVADEYCVWRLVPSVAGW